MEKFIINVYLTCRITASIFIAADEVKRRLISAI